MNKINSPHFISSINMNEKSSEKYMFGLALNKLVNVFIALLLIPILVYILNFGNHTFSSLASDWGAFGDYIGGVLNPILGLASIVILGHISIIIGNNSIKQQKELFYEEQRILAYQELVRNTKTFRETLDKLVIRMHLADKIETDDKSVGYNIIEGFTKPIEDIISFANYLVLFKENYSHLFKYQFQSNEHIEMLDELVDYKTQNISYFSGKSYGPEIQTKSIDKKINNFIGVLKKELPPQTID